MFKKIIFIMLSLVGIIKADIQLSFINKFDVPIEVDLTKSPEGKIGGFTLTKKGTDKAEKEINIPNLQADEQIKLTVAARGFDKVKKEIKPKNNQKIFIEPKTIININ